MIPDLCTRPPTGWTCSRYEGHPGPCAARPVPDEEPVPRVTGIPDAAHWIAILHRRSVADAERMSRIEERLRRLETPRWRRSRNRG